MKPSQRELQKEGYGSISTNLSKSQKKKKKITGSIADTQGNAFIST
jgi:hypothetical protein